MIDWKKAAKAISIGGALGALTTLVLLFGQNAGFFFYLLGPPYYIDALTVRSGALVSPITFVYYSIIYSVVAYMVMAAFSKLTISVSIVSFVALHILLLYLAIDLFAEAFGRALRIWFQGDT